MKWTSRILILAVFVAAMGGCQKGQKAEVSKERKSGAKAASSGAKSSGKSSKSASTTAKVGSAGEKSGSARLVRPGTLTMVDNGRSFDVKRGEVIIVRLDSNHSVGSSWALTERVGAVLKQEGTSSYARNTTRTGKVISGGTETWRFRAVGLGRETVKLQYGRKWESIPERTFRFTATVR